MIRFACLTIFCASLFPKMGGAQEASGGNGSWERYDWLTTPDAQTFTAKSGASSADPFAVVSGDMLWQDSTGVEWKRPVADTVAVSYSTTSQTRTSGSVDAGTKAQSLGVQVQPVSAVTLRGDVHDSLYDATDPDLSTTMDGARLSVEGHLPFNANLTLAVNSEETEAAAAGASTRSYDAQYRQPLGKVPLTAVVKANYTETSRDQTGTTRAPSLDQSLVWKPAQETTVEMGLRQQQYQDMPGVSNIANEALFADWSQAIAPQISWHSYAEVLNSKTSQDTVAPTPNANGSVPSSAGLVNLNNSSLPTSLTDQSVTFSTGPSFQLQKDLSANLEYSDRFDRASTQAAQDHRVSISLKGTF